MKIGLRASRLLLIFAATWLITACQTVGRQVGDARTPLHTQGAAIIDARGAPVRLLSVNWFGAESSEFVVGGLDKQPLAAIARTIRAGGFNSVRLPWSNEMVETNPMVGAEYLTANPNLQGKSALEIFDAVIDALGAEGLMVILDNHRSRGDWCCDEHHGDGLWHTPAFPESAWLADWRAMALRYRDHPHVVAAELRNEIRPDPSQSLTPTWGDGDQNSDWRAAAMRGGEAVLEIAPHWLIIVGGLRYQEDLTDVRGAPVTLSVPGRLVYAAHDYVWWRDEAQLSDPAAFAAASHRRWGYIMEPDQPYTAPVYISEWGGCVQPNSRGQPCAGGRPGHAEFVFAFAAYAREANIGFAYWPLNGTQSAGYNRTRGEVEGYGVLKPDWSGYASDDVIAALIGDDPSPP